VAHKLAQAGSIRSLLPHSSGRVINLPLKARLYLEMTVTIAKVCQEYGFTAPVICTPEELMGK